MSSPAPAPTSTRLLAKEAGLQLLRAGQRPTAERIRQLIGQGAQQTILSALDDLWIEVGERLRDPRLPTALLAPVTALWSAAVSEAGAQWAEARAALEAQRDAAQAEIARLVAAAAAAEQARLALAARGEEQAQRLAEVQEALGAAHQAQVAMDAALAEQRAATVAAEQGHTALAERFDREQERTARALDQERQAQRKLVREMDDLRRENHVLEVNLARAEQQVAGLQAQMHSRETDWQRVVMVNERLEAAVRQAEGAAQAAQKALQRCQEQREEDKEARRQLEDQLARAAEVRQGLEDQVAHGAQARQELTAELAARRQDVAVLSLAREQAEGERAEARQNLARVQEEARQLQATVTQLALAAAHSAGVTAAGAGSGDS